MKTTPPARKEDVRDPIGKTGWPQERGRDGERTPMQWDASQNAGFSHAQKTWLPVPESATRVNVAVEEQDPTSILSFYKNLIPLRHREPTLRNGDYITLNPGDAQVLSYLRRNQGAGDSVLVAMNMSAEPKSISFDLSGLGVKHKTLELLLRSPQGPLNPASLTDITIPPFGVLIGAVH